MPLPPIEPERDPLLDRRGFRIGAVAVVVVGALVAGLLIGLSGGSHHVAKRQPTLSAPGRLLAYDDVTGRLVFEDVDGRHRVVISGVLTGNPLVSPDGRYVVTDSGNNLLRLGSDTVHVLRSPASSANGTASMPAQPFADHDRLLVAPRQFSARARVRLLPTVGGHALNLGAADDVAADPDAPAAYVTVAVGHSVPAGGDSNFLLQPDGRIEWRQPGRPARVLVTAARLDQLAGLPRGAKMVMSTTPSPDGSRTLVYGRSLESQNTGVVLAVFDSRGRLVDKVTGPRIIGGDWSQTGDRVAYFDASNRLVVWQPAAHDARSLSVPPSSESPWSDCVWAPNNSWLVCIARPAVQGSQVKRLLVDLTNHRAEVTGTVDEPLLWQ